MKIYMLWRLAGLLVLFLLVYDFLPNIYARWFSPKVRRKIDGAGNRIALSFDDGPNAKFTPPLLDLLAQHQVKATFFVLGEKARQHPELIQRIVDEGHAIGIHSTAHRSAWLSSPWQTVQDLETSQQILAAAGHNVKLYRPPWGTFNLLTLPTAVKRGLHTVLWSLSPSDWRKTSTPDKICAIILHRVKPGDIILLHDNRGSEGAPSRTLKALSAIIPVLKSRGYTFVTIQEA